MEPRLIGKMSWSSNQTNDNAPCPLRIDIGTLFSYGSVHP